MTANTEEVWPRIMNETTPVAQKYKWKVNIRKTKLMYMGISFSNEYSKSSIASAGGEIQVLWNSGLSEHFCIQVFEISVWRKIKRSKETDRLTNMKILNLVKIKIFLLRSREEKDGLNTL